MHKLYFQHSDGHFSLITDDLTGKSVTEIIRQDVANRNPHFKIYYIRQVSMDDAVWFDVGSHTEFYIMTERDLINEGGKNAYTGMF